MAEGSSGKLPLKVYFPGYNTTKAFIFDREEPISAMIEIIKDKAVFLQGEDALRLYLPPEEGRPHGRYVKDSEILDSLLLKKMELVEIRTARAAEDAEQAKKMEAAKKKEAEKPPTNVHLVTSLKNIVCKVPHMTHTFSDVASIGGDAKPETQFMIQVTVGSEKWTVSRSETSIRVLCDVLIQTFSEEKLPKCPPKLDKVTLPKLLKKLLSKPVLIMSPQFRHFLLLELPEGAETLEGDDDDDKNVKFADVIARSISSDFSDFVPSVDIIVTIPKEEIIEGSSTLIYLIDLKTNSDREIQWTVVRSFSDFGEMHTLIESNFPGEASTLQLPPEGKNITMSPALVKMQRMNLQKYLQKVIDTEYFRKFGPVYEFFDIESLEELMDMSESEITATVSAGSGSESGQQGLPSPTPTSSTTRNARSGSLDEAATTSPIANKFGSIVEAPEDELSSGSNEPSAALSAMALESKDIGSHPLPASIDQVPIANDVLGLFSISVSAGRLDQSCADIVFEMDVQDEGSKWSTSHTYSEFVSLHETMKEYFDQLPDLPRVKDFSKKSLNTLGSSLSIYLVVLLRKEDSDQCAPFLTFLAIQYEEEPSEDEEGDDEEDEEDEEKIVDDPVSVAVAAVAATTGGGIAVGSPPVSSLPSDPNLDRVLQDELQAVMEEEEAKKKKEHEQDQGEEEETMSSSHSASSSLASESPKKTSSPNQPRSQPRIATEESISMSSSSPGSFARSRSDSKTASIEDIALPPAQIAVQLETADTDSGEKFKSETATYSPAMQVTSSCTTTTITKAAAEETSAASSFSSSSEPIRLKKSESACEGTVTATSNTQVLADSPMLKSAISFVESMHSPKSRFMFECSRIFTRLLTEALFSVPLSRALAPDGVEIFRVSKKVCAVFIVPNGSVLERAWRQVSFEGVTGFVYYRDGETFVLALPEVISDAHIILSQSTTSNVDQVIDVVTTLLKRGANIDRIIFATVFISSPVLAEIVSSLPTLKIICTKIVKESNNIPRLAERYLDCSNI